MTDLEHLEPAPPPEGRHRADNRWDKAVSVLMKRPYVPAVVLGTLVLGLSILDIRALESKHEAESANQTPRPMRCSLQTEIAKPADYSHAIVRDKLGLAHWRHYVYVLDVTCNPQPSENQLAPGIRIDRVSNDDGDYFMECVVMPSGLTSATGLPETQAYCLHEAHDV